MEKKRPLRRSTRYVNSRMARANLLRLIILYAITFRYREKRAEEGKIIARSFLQFIRPTNYCEPIGVRINREKKGRREEGEESIDASIHKVENRLLSRRFDDTDQGEKIPTILTLGSFSGAIDPRPVSILIGIESQLPKITRLFSPATGLYTATKAYPRLRATIRCL